MAKGFFAENFVWTATQDSVKHGKISMLACAETVFSVAAYLWIAWYFETATHILISLLAAPLVLLRSNRSVALGKHMAKQYWEGLKFPAAFVIAWIGLILVIATIMAASMSVTIQIFDADFAVARPLISAFFVGAIGLTFGVASRVFFRRSGIPDLLQFSSGKLLKATACAVSLILFATWAILFTLGVHRLGPLSIGVLFLTTVLGLFLSVVTYAHFAPGFALGVWGRTILIRVSASLRYPVQGFRTMPKNWRRLLFQTDFFIVPELVPSATDAMKIISPSNLIKAVRFELDFAERPVAVFILLLCYIPALAYRYSIKSTCWLYLPLIYLVTLPGNLQDRDTRAKWLQAFSTKALNWAFLILAAITLLIAVAAAINPAALAAILGQNIPVSAFSIWFVLDLATSSPGNLSPCPMPPSSCCSSSGSTVSAKTCAQTCRSMSWAGRSPPSSSSPACAACS